MGMPLWKFVVAGCLLLCLDLGHTVFAGDKPPTGDSKDPPKLLRIFEHEGKITGVDFAADNRFLASCGGGVVQVWDYQKGVEKLKIKRKDSSFTDVRFHPDNKSFATATREGKVFVWNLKGGLLATHEVADEQIVWRIAFNKDGGKLAAASANRTAYVWEGDNVFQRIIDHTGEVRDVAFSPNGKTLVTSGYDHTARVWDLENRKGLHIVKHDPIVVFGVDCRPDGMHVASVAGAGETIQIWHLFTGKEIGTITTGHPGYSYHRVRWGPKGKMLAVCGGIFSKGYLSLWSVDIERDKLKARRLAILQTDKRGADIHGLAFSPDGRILATGNSEGKVRLWQTEP